MADSPRIEELKRRVQSDPASIAFAALAEEYRRAERLEEAIATCTAGLVRHPSYLSAHVTLGRALIEVGRLQEAREELEYVLKLAPENLAAIRGLAEIHHRIGEDSREHYQPAENTAPGPAAAPPMSVAEIQAASGVSNSPASTKEDRAVNLPVSTAERDIAPTYSEPLLASVPHVTHGAPDVTHSAPIEPAPAGLEEFLKAILRARAAAR